MKRKSRPRLRDRIGFWSATSKRIDGLWVGVSPVYYLFNEEAPKVGLRRVEEALHLIETHDRLRYDRITHDLERIWVHHLFHYAGQFTRSLNTCELDCRFVAERTTEVIAAMIVHEATHARLEHCGIAYKETMRARIEAVCIRRELAFAAKLPDGETVREIAEINLETYAVPEVLTNAAREKLMIDAGVEELRMFGTPEWEINAVLRFGRTLSGIRTARQRMFNSFRRLNRFIGRNRV